MPDRIYGNEYRTTLVCVDSWKGGESSGRLYNPYWGEGESFEGLMDFLKKMEALLDQMQLPQSFTAKRSFGPPPGTGGHVFHPGTVPAECQLAGYREMGGGRTGGILPQRAGAASDDGQRGIKSASQEANIGWMMVRLICGAVRQIMTIAPKAKTK